MKRIISLFLALALFSLSGCGSNKAFPSELTCEDILKAAESAFETPEAETFYSAAEDNLDALSLSLWADGVYKECEEWSLLSDYAVFCGAGTSTFEIAVLKPKSDRDAQKLLDLIERRKETLSLGDKGAYDPDFDYKMKNSVLKTDGGFVIFLITDNNEAAIEAIEKLKQ